MSAEIVEVIKEYVELLCEAKKERHVQDTLAALLECKCRQTLSSEMFPDVEVDLLGEGFTIEVKFNESVYAGVGQVLSQKYLYNIRSVYLLHIHTYLDSKFVNGFVRLAEAVGFIGILVDKREMKVRRIINE